MPPSQSTYKLPIAALVALLVASIIIACCCVAALGKRFKSTWPW